MSEKLAINLDVEGLRAGIRLGWGNGPADPDACAAAGNAAAQLAKLAYGQNDPEARRTAENIIYKLNLDSCFAPPSYPPAAVVWTTLMQAKLAALRSEFDAAPKSTNITNDEMRAEMESAVAKWGAHNHPLLSDLEASGKVETYRIWAKNWFGSCYGFSLQLASLIQRTTGEAKKVVLENLNDEFDDAVTHDVLRVRFYSSLGLEHSPEGAIDDPDWVLASTELLNLRTGLCAISDAMPALGCFFSVEGNWPPECRRHVKMNKDRGLDDNTIEYWTTHAFADEHHSAEWMDVVLAICETSEQRAAVMEGCTVQLRLRWRMYDAIQAKVQALK